MKYIYYIFECSETYIKLKLYTCTCIDVEWVWTREVLGIDETGVNEREEWREAAIRESSESQVKIHERESERRWQNWVSKKHDQG